MINAVLINQNENNIVSNFLKELENVQFLGFCSEMNNVENLKSLENIDLIIFEIGQENSDEILKEVKILKEKKSNLKFLALSSEINSALVTKVLGSGVDDFLLKPVIKNILKASIEKIFKSKEEKLSKNCRVISFYSTKGGVGKSSIALNMAYLIAKTNKNVCFLDLSLSDEDLSELIEIRKTNQNIILNSLNSASKEMILSLIPKHDDVNLYGFALKYGYSDNLKLNGDLIIKLINSLRKLFDYIIIDCPNHIDFNTVEILNNSNLILYNLVLNSSSKAIVENSIEKFQNIGYKNSKIRIIFNRFVEDNKKYLDEIQKEINNKIITYKVPNNYLTLADAINQKKVLDETNPNSNIAKAIKNIALDIMNSKFDDLELNTTDGTMYSLMKQMGE